MAAWGFVLLGFLSVASQAHAQEAAVANKISLGNVQLVVTAADGTQLIRNSGAAPTKLLASPQVSPAETLSLTFSMADNFKPQQMFLALVHKATGAAAYAVAKSKKDSSDYTISLPFSNLQKQVGNQAGEYIASLLVGDPTVSEALQWEFGSLELVLPASAPASPGAMRSAQLQPTSSQLPVIQHIFRSAEKRPPAAVSSVFTVLVMVPLTLVLLYVSTGLGINFNAWPRDSAGSAACVSFHVLLAAMLGLYLLFWTRLNLMQTLPLVGGMGILLALSGHRALATLADARLTSKKD
eukprot:CAMPEP_0119108106 /NCGR_PEP_ID=MMETSP1180-20130426/13470_1 /TAXON_ID=3052 ORGANISM="Chlamydomonas cf sp, Strain CCMP681" /NCGR_SAMPLE_ID=MMETSP1180 /ASSEMBLY_ACC=CAM_ASM_000741 /LENGTH=295 /DNA_ID=CAMNT_0007093689 /DNA_START=72 /DNA_END=959 /DNA_ORIENTATION=-